MRLEALLLAQCFCQALELGQDFAVIFVQEVGSMLVAEKPRYIGDQKLLSDMYDNWTCLKKVDATFNRIRNTDWRKLWPTRDIQQTSSVKQ